MSDGVVNNGTSETRIIEETFNNKNDRFSDQSDSTSRTIAMSAMMIMSGMMTSRMTPSRQNMMVY